MVFCRLHFWVAQLIAPGAWYLVTQPLQLWKEAEMKRDVCTSLQIQYVIIEMLRRSCTETEAGLQGVCAAAV